MKIFTCTIYWLIKEITFIFPAENSQDFINKLKEGLANTKESPSYKVGEIVELSQKYN